MKNVLLLTTIVVLLPVGSSAQQGSKDPQKTLAFANVTVIDCTGAPSRSDMTVVVRGERIEALAQTGDLAVPQNAQVIDGTGKFLIPGLWDMHVHLWIGKRYLPLFTANGITGVRVMWGRPEYHKWRKGIEAGQIIGPRMVIASPIVGHGPYHFPEGNEEDEGRKIVRKVKKEGADFIKVYNYIPRDAYFAIADEAKKQGIHFAGHVPYSVSAVEASDAGQQSIEHGHGVLPACSSREECRKKFVEAWPARGIRMKLLANLDYDEEKAAAFFARLVKNDTWVCPTTLVWSEASYRDEEDLINDLRFEYMPAYSKSSWDPKNNTMVALATGDGRADCQKLFQKKLDIIGSMKAAGVGLLAGTDALAPYCFPGFGLHEELVLLVRAGLSPMEALRTATYNPAKFFGTLDSMGTIEQGKVADLVLLEANPLQDISNTRKIAAVVTGGRIYEKESLQDMFAQVKASRLHEAAMSGDIEDVESLIAEGVDVNARDQQGLTPALVGLHAWESAVTDLLLEKGADTNAPHLLAYTGDLTSMKNLLERHAPVDSLDGLTLLHAAAKGGHTDIVEFLISKGFAVTATTEYGNTTPLDYAALGNHQEVAGVLIANGASVDSAKPNPIVAAAYAGHKDMIEYLMSKGADINKGPETPLHQAVSPWWDTNMAKLLIEAGADVNARNEKGNTPLHLAVKCGEVKMVELLVSNGANLSVRNNQGEDPVSMAKRQLSAPGRKEIIELFRKHETRK